MVVHFFNFWIAEVEVEVVVVLQEMISTVAAILDITHTNDILHGGHRLGATILGNRFNILFLIQIIWDLFVVYFIIFFPKILQR